MAQFNQIRRAVHLPDMIVSEIMSQIDAGRLKPGDTLPTETALAESFGVSRNVVREAIARLRSDGVVDTKQGRGACVLPPSERSTFRIDLDELREQGQVASLFELRGLLEIDAAGIAAVRRKHEQLDEMEAAIRQMEGHRDFDRLRLEADAAFHRAIGQATQNDYLASIMDYLSGRLKETIQATSAVYAGTDLIEVTIAEHRTVLDAIRAENANKARQAMHQHVFGAAQRLGVPGADTL